LSLVAVFPLGTLCLVLSTQAFGWAIDRWGAARLLPIYLIPFALGLAVHAMAPTVWWSGLGVMLMGISGGGQSTLPAACWAEFFGTRHIGAIKSTVVSMMVLASAIGPGITGWLIDLGLTMPMQLSWLAVLVFALSVSLILPVRAALSRLPSA
jgi:MFS family permease